MRLPNGITTIGEFAFHNCSYHIEDIKLPNSIIEIKHGAFLSTNLHKINLSTSLIAIHQSAFECCVYLSSIVFPSSLRKIGKRCFYKSGLKEVVFNEGLKYILGDAFYDTLIHSIKLPSSVIYLGTSSFCNCNVLCDVLSLGSITELCANTFMFCKNLESVQLPDSLVSIGNSTFSSCESLQKINFPNSLIEISDQAFIYCNSLRGVIDLSHIRKLGSYAFMYTLISKAIMNENCSISDWPIFEKGVKVIETS